MKILLNCAIIFRPKYPKFPRIILTGDDESFTGFKNSIQMRKFF